MRKQYLLPMVLVAVGASVAWGEDFSDIPLPSSIDAVEYSGQPVYCSGAMRSLADEFSEREVIRDSCGDAGLGCGKTCVSCQKRCRTGAMCSRCCGQKEHDSCLDWILPRSHLPFPLMKGLVEGQDVPLPLPLGTSVIFTELNRHFVVDDVRLGFANTPVSVERIGVTPATFHASSQIARVDLWALPFINIYGLVGHTRSTGDVAVTIDRFPLPFSPPTTINIPVELEGTTAGWGATAGIGSKHWFAMLDVNESWTNFSELDSSMTALVIAPRVGLVINRPLIKGEVHIGAMWQNTDQTVELTVNHPLLGNGLHVEVDQIEPRKWNFLVGGLWALDERLQLLVEGGSGGRSYILSGITVRY